MDVIIASLKDVIKYGIISYTNTGDKTLDNLINTLFIALLTSIFAKELWEKLYHMYMFNKHKFNKTSFSKNVLTDKNYYIYKNMTIGKKFSLITWDINSNPLFTDGFVEYMYKNVAWILTKSVNFYDIDNYKLSDIRSARSKLIVLKKSLKCDELYPIYLSKDNEIICLMHEGNTSNLLIGFNNNDVLTEFIKKVKTYIKSDDEEKKQSNEKPTCYVYDYELDSKYKIYQDRTFDLIVTKYKNKIISMLEDFKRANKIGRSPFNGQGTYNVGFMLYGKPGTGKTSIIKAICNYLGRDACVINMNKIKTLNAFKSVLMRNPYGTCKDLVYVFEEMDCVEGILDRNIMEEKEELDDDVEKKELNDKYMRILELRSKTQDTSMQEKLDKEMKEINQQLDKLKNKLSLGTILTVLDGTEEMRDRVIIGTTNHVDRLDPALLRAGRFDIKIELNEFNHDEIKEYLTMLFKDNASPKEWEYMNNKRFREGEFTPVQIRNLCHEYRTLSKVTEMLSEPKGVSPMNRGCKKIV